MPAGRVHEEVGRVSADIGEALGQLIDRSHLSSPSDLPALVHDTATFMGAVEVVIYLASYEQRFLQPLSGAGVPDREAMDIDATLAGRAYRTGTMLEGDAGENDTHHRLWVPLLDGTHRIGVLEMALDMVDDSVRVDARHFAGVVAELVVTRSAYGDVLPLVRRRQPMSLAAEMQWGLLPPLTFMDGRISVAGVLEPAYNIAGDTFDYAVNAHRLSFAIIDAMGHGFEATLLAAVAVSAYRHSRRAGRDLAETYAAMDEVISARFGPDRFVTAQLGELDASSGVLRWLNAGHPAPLLTRAGRVVGHLACDPTFPVGFGGSVAEIAETRLEPGDALLCYTDGVIEARSPDGEFFGDERLGDLLGRALTAQLPPPETVRRLVHALLEHQAEHLQDDATTLLIGWQGRHADAPSG